MSQPTGNGISRDDRTGRRLSRVIAALMVAVGLMFGGQLPHASADTWVPANGPTFNNPVKPKDRFPIQTKLVQAINHTPKGAIIRISIYSWDRREVAKALIAAKRRGVTVQVLMNNHQTTRAQRMLYAALGRNPKNKNFAYECKAGCRSAPEYLHTKFYLFSQTGAAHNVVFIGSANFTLNAVRHQWNDIFAIREHPLLFNQFVALFDDMRHDYRTNQPPYEFCDAEKHLDCNFRTDPFFAWVFPRKVSSSHDPVIALLDEIGCHYTGTDGKTKATTVRLQMHTMRFERGIYIARKIHTLWENGCDVKVLYGISTSKVNQAFGRPTGRGKMPLRSSGFDFNDDLEVDRYTHQKTLTVDGKFAGVNHAFISLTGSSNWSGRGNSGDEIMFLMRGQDWVRRYQANWNLIWNHYSRNAYTTTMSHWGQTEEGKAPAIIGGDPTPHEHPGGSWEDD